MTNPNRHFRSLCKVFSLLTLSILISGAAKADPSFMEFAQSVPEQTTLGVPNVPFAGDVWIKMIKGAKSSIDLGQMYLNNIPEQGLKNTLEPVIQELENAANRGVKIRLIISAQMQNTDVPTLQRFQKMKNAEVRIYDLGKLTGGIIHAKFFIVDHQEVFVGSQNMDWKALTQIHEMGVHLIDSGIANKLTAVFEKDWATIAAGKLDGKSNVPTACSGLDSVDLVASPPELNPVGVCDSIPVLVSLIQKAQKKIAIQVMDYSTSGSKGAWTEIDDALRAAAKRGVQVRLMVSHWATVQPEIDQLKDLSKVPGIQLKITTVPELKTGFLSYARLIHSKYMIVDEDTFWMGTSNWSQGYFYNTRGVEIVIQKPDFAQLGIQIFNNVWSQTYSDFIDVNKTYPAPRKSLR